MKRLETRRPAVLATLMGYNKVAWPPGFVASTISTFPLVNLNSIEMASREALPGSAGGPGPAGSHTNPHSSTSSVNMTPGPNPRPVRKLRAIAPEPIRMEDRSQVAKNTWAKDCEISSYEIVNETYVAWQVRVKTSKGTWLSVFRRYSEFVTLHDSLLARYPKEAALLPELPPKSVISKFDAAFLEERREGLDFFLKSVVLSNLFGKDNETKQFCLTYEQSM